MPPTPSNLPYVYNENNHNALENIKEGKKIKTDEISNSSCKTCVKRTQMHRSKPKKKNCLLLSFIFVNTRDKFIVSVDQDCWWCKFFSSSCSLECFNLG